MQVPPSKLDPIGVVGIGLLGRGIVASFLGAGFRVIAFDVRHQARTEAHIYIRNAISEMVRHSALSPLIAESWPERYSVCDSLDSFEPCAFVIESVVEDLATQAPNI